jgi:hypothetical protein
MRHDTHWGVVFSDVVVRAVSALQQYKGASTAWPESEQFEATLTLSVAQTVLGAASELERALRRQVPVHQPDLSELNDLVSLDDTSYLSRSSQTGVLRQDELTGAELLNHLRNALSHPVPCASNKTLPLTGYASVPNHYGRIERFSFVDSPWVDVQEGEKNIGRPIIKYAYARRLDKKDEARSAEQRSAITHELRVFQREWDKARRLRVHEEGGRLSIRLDDSPTDYVPFIRLSTSVADLADMCEFLAERYGRWLKPLKPSDVAMARSNPLVLSGPSR